MGCVRESQLTQGYLENCSQACHLSVLQLPTGLVSLIATLGVEPLAFLIIEK